MTKGFTVELSRKDTHTKFTLRVLRGEEEIWKYSGIRNPRVATLLFEVLDSFMKTLNKLDYSDFFERQLSSARV